MILIPAHTTSLTVVDSPIKTEIQFVFIYGNNNNRLFVINNYKLQNFLYIIYLPESHCCNFLSIICGDHLSFFCQYENWGKFSLRLKTKYEKNE